MMFVEPSAGFENDVDPFERALGWRARGGWTRSGQAALVALLCWTATGSALIGPWLATTLICGALDVKLSAWLLGRPHTRAAVTLAGASQALTALSFALVVLPLLHAPTPLHLAEAVLLLCATCLNNAMMSRGSRLVSLCLVGPAAALLVAGPFLAGLFGYQIGLTDAWLLALGGVAFTVFILRLAATFNAERLALKTALDALAREHAATVAAGKYALESKQRWRMIFEHSPLARLCFDASALHAALGAEGAFAGARLGDRLKSKIGSVANVFALITLGEANQGAIDLCGDDLTRPHFTEATLDAFCEALNDIGDDGVLPVFPGELIRADGEIVDVEVHYRLAPDEGAPWGLCLATYVDVTQSRRLAREQREALDAADAANRAKSDFLAVISHEIRTPLNGVLGMAQAMAYNPLARAQRARLQVISESGSALLAIVDDLLDLAKIEAGRMEIVNADFDLLALARSVHAAYAAEAARKGLGFTLHVDPSMSEGYRGDAGRLRQVLGALISNAIKFTPRGEVSIRLAPSAAGVCCEVRDTGIGIPPDRMGRLFEPFGQADSSMTRRYGGAGLGLAICRQLSRAMRGEISARSRPGEGSVFTLDLPLRARPCDVGADGVSIAPLRPVRVLAAEDNPVNQQVLKALLAEIGLDPTIVENGMEAVQACEDGDWDLILMDVQMPIMDGVSATRAIRAREAELGRLQTPIIAVTANAMTHQVASYLAAGVNAVVSKPIDVEELFSTMIAVIAPDAPQESASAAA